MIFGLVKATNFSESLFSADHMPQIPDLLSSIPSENPIDLFTELSPQCQGAFINMITDPEFVQCVPILEVMSFISEPDLLLNVKTDPIANGPKLLPIIDAICHIQKCPDGFMNNSLTEIMTYCNSDFDSKNPDVQLTVDILTLYSPIRDIICFMNNEGVNCIVETAINLLKLPSPPFKLFGEFIDKLVAAEPKIICTPCNKAIVNTFLNFLKEHPDALNILYENFKFGETELSYFEFFGYTKCGFQFEDGKIPDTSIDPRNFTY
ncbi:hypothetical protein F8M41_007040 [Gigaspora margarita]|uniref:DUF7729 domain-containing protein n=1 Tax=Gigaspora margarita TaxID=4874 RepID=A0A8H4EV48_GIGMA|nr:hypothetical protein F8M41_007040 [Gigaspora margarita]